MPGDRNLKLEDLQLDLENPRISIAHSQREALQKIIDDQGVKLQKLAELIVNNGLNPMDRWLVLPSQQGDGKYVVVEGNRRLAALRLLNNSHALDSYDLSASAKRQFRVLSDQFELKSIEPISCYEVEDRASAAMWISQRHTGENEGGGIVGWNGVATQRFRGTNPALQAFDFVVSHGNLTPSEQALLESPFPISTLDRLLSTPAVRSVIGVDIVEGKLTTDLPIEEILKPLRRFVIDLASKRINVTMLKKRDQMVEYVGSFGGDLPDLKKRSASFAPVDELLKPSVKLPAPKANPRPSLRSLAERKTLVPRACKIVVTNPKIAEIFKELRKLSLKEFPHSISVLFRVFLEQSVDHFLYTNGIPREENKGPRTVEKKLRQKVEEAVKALVANGVREKDLNGIAKGIDQKNNPLYINTLHDYVHNMFYSPTERELIVAWDNSQFFFERIWQ